MDVGRDVHVQTAEVLVAGLPPEHPLYEDVAVHVSWHGVGDLWVVSRRSKFLDVDGEWAPYPGRDERFTDRWESRHVMPYDVAVLLAGQAALSVTIRGKTVAELEGMEA